MSESQRDLIAKVAELEGDNWKRHPVYSNDRYSGPPPHVMLTKKEGGALTADGAMLLLDRVLKDGSIVEFLGGQYFVGPMFAGGTERDFHCDTLEEALLRARIAIGEQP